MLIHEMAVIIKNAFVIFLFACFLGSVSQAGLFVTGMGGRINADYKNVTSSTGEVSDLFGELELVGVGGGYTTMTPGNFGYTGEVAFLGTNGQKLNFNPNWGVPWYYRVAGKANYTFSFGLYFEIGADIIGSFYQNVENHYFGLGVNFGIGYRINQNFLLTIAMDNSSVLFAGENRRVLRGNLIQLSYLF